MKQLIVNVPDNLFKSFVEFFKQIPGITIEESKTADIPEWHKPILEERMEEYRKNPNQGKDWDDFEKELNKI
ncbi:MAG TPA: addiction module protein [Bacteroidia bacterium]|jgi:hypothetical protein|nr:addiction module protein [Bacteroidia bacterium]